jgi:hypothetical protein
MQSFLIYIYSALCRNELTCDICIDIITDIDEWLTSDKTEQEIVDFVSQVRGSSVVNTIAGRKLWTQVRFSAGNNKWTSMLTQKC